jgi:hypothetical protein
VTRPEVTVRIRAWLETRDLPGLEPAFRALVTNTANPTTARASSVEELHHELDDALRVGGLVEGEP